MKRMKLMCVALMLLGSLPASSAWAGRGHGHHGHHHHGHGHHHQRGGGYGGIGLALGMGLLGYGLGVHNRAPHYPPSYGYPSAAYGQNYGYGPAYGPSNPPVYIQQRFR